MLNQKELKILFITNGLLLNKEKNVKNLIDIAPDIKNIFTSSR